MVRPSSGPFQPSRKPTNSKPVDVDALADHGADHRVEPGTVAAAGEDSDAHAELLIVVGSLQDSAA